MSLRYFHRYQRRIATEAVYGEKAVRFLYQTAIGRLMAPLLAQKFFSSLYGRLQDRPSSKKKIVPFVRKFGIDLSEYLPTKGRSEADPYGSFNEFFIRRFKEKAREFITGPHPSAFAEGRYMGYEALSDSIHLPVKGAFLRPIDLLGRKKWAFLFEGGPVLMARLCPVDYHRFHFLDDGRFLDSYRMAGRLHSVNPQALDRYGHVFFTNERAVSILETIHLGKVAMVEVGAICVGRIILTKEEGPFRRGEEKGYFLFGGSSVIVMGQKGRWTPSADILENTKDGLETFVRLGDQVGEIQSDSIL